jgi:hypothetical protein
MLIKLLFHLIKYNLSIDFLISAWNKLLVARLNIDHTSALNDTLLNENENILI